jgi:DNA-binding transcriptional MerR regulator
VYDEGGRTIALYARSQVAVVRRIYSYQQLGVNLPGIEMLLRLQEHLAQRRRRR